MIRCCLYQLRRNVYENEHELLRVEQIIRPTGLLDPEISVRPVEGQIDDLIGEVNKETKNHHKVLITTLTKRMAEGSDTVYERTWHPCKISALGY